MIAVVASPEGGGDIEKIAETSPEKILKTMIDPLLGIKPFHCREIGLGLGFEGESLKSFSRFLTTLYKMFMELDASLVEINPLVETENGEIIALDAKMDFDDNALYRHNQLEELRDEDEEYPAEREAEKNHLNYIRLDGTIGCMVNGAGLAMATMDLIKLHGASPANFLDVGGSATRERVAKALEIILHDPSVEAILVNIFGGIMRCDVIAEGIVDAAKKTKISVPLVVRLNGTNSEEGRMILSQSGLKIEAVEELSAAAKSVVSLAKGGA
jgi:succinyl-CoA synthetase beta subunit